MSSDHDCAYWSVVAQVLPHVRIWVCLRCQHQWVTERTDTEGSTHDLDNVQ